MGRPGSTRNLRDCGGGDLAALGFHGATSVLRTPGAICVSDNQVSTNGHTEFKGCHCMTLIRAKTSSSGGIELLQTFEFHRHVAQQRGVTEISDSHISWVTSLRNTSMIEIRLVAQQVVKRSSCRESLETSERPATDLAINSRSSCWINMRDCRPGSLPVL